MPQTQIDIVENELLSFYALWQNMLANKKTAELIENAFQNQDDSFSASKIVFQNVSLNHIVKHLSETEQKITSGEVKTIDDLCQTIKAFFPENFTNESSENLKKFYNSFHKFHQKTKKERQQIVNILSDTVHHKTHQDVLQSVSSFFNSSAHLQCVMSVLPKKIISGCAGFYCMHQFFSLEKDSNAQDYIDDTLVQKRRLGTVMHEAAHALYHQSEIYHDIRHNPDSYPHMRKFIYHFAKWVNAHEMNSNSNSLAVAFNALDEGFASCTNVFLSEKQGEIFPAHRKWYHGFEAANQLAPCMYPIVKAYLNNKKTLDDSFFEKLNQVCAEKLFQSTPKKEDNSSSKTSVSPSSLNSKRGVFQKKQR